MSAGIRNISFAGAGNVTWHLAQGFRSKGFVIGNIWSRNPEKAVEIASLCHATVVHSPDQLKHSTDLIIIAVSDDAIQDVASQIGDFNGLVIHTAGSVEMSILAPKTARYGVMYPLQTFLKNSALDLSLVPFFLEASDNPSMQLLKEMASRLSVHIYETDSDTRLKLHVAAVFAGNYTNFLYTIATELLTASHLTPDAISPLITEIARKAVNGNPSEYQTGPARRNDTQTINKHLAVLAGEPEKAEIYRLLAQAIINKYHKPI